jgi:carbon-monoxide dehydrogenase medium subunit
MKAVAYTLEPAGSVAQAMQSLQDGGWSSKAVAGGQSLGAMLNLRLAQPEALVDLQGLEALRRVQQSTDHVVYGALTTHAELEDGRLPDPSRGLLSFVARGIAYRAVRNRGTLGGSLCHADPAADWVSTMSLLGATMEIEGTAGSRLVPAAEFFVSAFQTTLADGELLVAVRVPRLSASSRWAYRKFCRKTGEFAQAIVAALREPDTGMERVVLGALDGAPQVAQRPGLIASLQTAVQREQFVRQLAPGLNDTRMALQGEMLRLACLDLDNAP